MSAKNRRTDDRPLLPEHCKAARYLLGWTMKELHERSGVSHTSIRRFEMGGGNITPRSRRDILAAFDEAGVVLTPGEPGPSQVRCADGMRVTIKQPR